MRPAAIVLARTGGPFPDDSRRLTEPGLLVAIAVLLGLLLFGGGSSTSIVWAVGLIGLGILSVVAWQWVLRGTVDPDPLVGPGEPGSIHPGEIEALSQSTRRAFRGLPFSQVVVAMRAREAFLERVRLAHGLPLEAIRAAEADPEALRRLTRDAVLAEFLYLQAGSLEERYRWVSQARTQGGFTRDFGDVLDRMEGWR